MGQITTLSTTHLKKNAKNLAPMFGDFSQIENDSEINPPIVSVYECAEISCIE